MCFVFRFFSPVSTGTLERFQGGHPGIDLRIVHAAGPGLGSHLADSGSPHTEDARRPHA